MTEPTNRRPNIALLLAAALGVADTRSLRDTAPAPTPPEPPRTTPPEKFIERQHQRASSRRAVAEAERAERRKADGWRNGPQGVKLVELAKAKRERRAALRRAENEQSFSTASRKNTADRNGVSTETTGGGR